MPVCNVCRESFEGIWDPSKTRCVCTINEWEKFAELPDDFCDRPGDPSENVEQYDIPQLIFGHHATQESFMQAVSEGCVVCSTMRRNIKGQEVSPQVSTLGYYTFFRFSLAERKSRIRVDLYKNGM